MNIEAIINELQNKRAVFHSKADFQFAFAWEIQIRYPQADVRLEFSTPEEPSKRIDILVRFGRKYYPIELKYRTKVLQERIDEEPYFLKNHGAQDLGKYDFVKDICRIENYKSYMTDYDEGYAVFLTNDPSYWNPPRNKYAGYAQFSVHQGATKYGKMEWGELLSDGTIKHREEPLVLTASYRIDWKDYSNLNTKNGIFKYSIVKV